MTFRSTALTAITFTAVVILPLDFQPLRFEPFEPHHAGLLALLVFFALPFIQFPRPTYETRWLLWVALIWCAALMISTILALSPAQALSGDLIRKMGLWTRLALIGGGLLLGSQLELAKVWRWFWLAGVTVAVYIILQALNVLIIGTDSARPAGPLGLATYSGGWLMLAILWSGIGLLGEASLIRWRRGVFFAGIALMLLALIVTEARAASIGLAVGVFTAGLTWNSRSERNVRRLYVLLAVLLAGVVSGIILLGRYNAGQRQDFTLRFREEMWTSALQVVREWPALRDVRGTTDPWQTLRPLIGYGLELFEPPHRPYIEPTLRPYIVNQVPDRAHNDWLDTLVMTGWLGTVARTALWLSVIWLALKRSGLWHPLAFVFMLSGTLVAAAFTWSSPWFPVAVTIGLIGGLWLWLLAASWWPARFGLQNIEAASSLMSILVLAILTAHLAELQFGFTTIATAWPAYLALGLLLAEPLAAPETNANKPRSSRHKRALTTPLYEDSHLLWSGLAVAGAVLIRSLTIVSASITVYLLLLSIMAAATYFLTPIPLRAWGIIALAWALGWVAGQSHGPEIVAVWDVIILVGGLGLMIAPAFREVRFKPIGAFYGVMFVVVLFFWGRDIAADVDLGIGLYAPDSLQRAEMLNQAAQLRPWDGGLLVEAGDAALEAGMNAQPPDSEWLVKARTWMERAVELHGYDAIYVSRLGVLRANLALVSNDPAFADSANVAFTAAARLWPGEVSIWREWARFTLQVREDPSRALELVQQALRVEPDNHEALVLLEEIEAAAE